MIPPQPSPGQRHPMVLQVHGGPHMQYGWAFFHEFQFMAGRGLSVLYTNPRLSVGYGQRWACSGIRQWGGPDYDDLMAAVDQAVELEGVDGLRLGIAGGSYGGFMTNWAVGHTDRFSAAVSMRGLSNLISDFGTTDVPVDSELSIGPFPWRDPMALWDRSPLKYVENVRTPLLLVHSELDMRCRIGQSEEFFTALRILGKEVEMVMFPQESHELSRSGRPDRRVHRLNIICAWLERWLATSDSDAAVSTDPARADND